MATTTAKPLIQIDDEVRPMTTEFIKTQPNTPAANTRLKAASGDLANHDKN